MYLRAGCAQIEEKLLLSEYADVIKEQVAEIIELVKTNPQAAIARVREAAVDTPVTSPNTSRKASTVSLSHAASEVDTSVSEVITGDSCRLCHLQFSYGQLLLT